MSTIEKIKASVPKGFIFYGKGPLKHLSKTFTYDICMFRDGLWDYASWNGNDDYYYALREGSEIAALNGLKREENKPMDKTEQYIAAQRAWMELFDVKVGTKFRVIRKCEDYENGWGDVWCECMKEGKGVYFYKLHSNPVLGLRMTDGYHYPFFCLEVIQPKLPDPIDISKDYKAEFKKNGGIKVGCQELSFDLVEKIYNTAKKTLD